MKHRDGARGEGRSDRSPLEDALAVTAFWREAGPRRWFAKNAVFDETFRQRFADLHFRAARLELRGWQDSAEGALALCVLLDQYPRNAYRGTAHMYATDPLARAVARRAVDERRDQEIDPDLRLFVYLPFAHSELLDDQDRSVALSKALGSDAVEHAQGHRDIIRRFGRFPHRNRMLARETTLEEQVFLDAGGFSG